MELRPGERLDRLNNGSLQLIQRPDAFRFGTDSVLLADFAAPRPHDRVCDLGCGTGAISILMAAHLQEACTQMDVFIHAIELQADIADMARRSVTGNSLEDLICVHAMDMRKAPETLGYESMTLCVCNPPYGRQNGQLKSRSESFRLARHECDITIEDICRTAASLLRQGGRFAVIYPAERALELMNSMEQARLSPKHIRTVQGSESNSPKHVLLCAVKDGGLGLHWLPPLILRTADGSPTPEAKRIYRNDTL